MTLNVLVTGGAGFIGSAVCWHLVTAGVNVLNVDALTYAGNLKSLSRVDNAPNYRFAKSMSVTGARSPRRSQALRLTMSSIWRPRAVDRSITASDAFIQKHPRDLLDAGGRAGLLARTVHVKAPGIPLPARLDR